MNRARTVQLSEETALKCIASYIQGVELTSLGPLLLSGMGCQPSGTWDLEHAIEHAHLCHPVVSSLVNSLVRLVKARSQIQNRLPL